MRADNEAVVTWGGRCCGGVGRRGAAGGRGERSIYSCFGRGGNKRGGGVEELIYILRGPGATRFI